MDGRRRHRLPLSAFATALVVSLALVAPAAHAAKCPGADQLALLSTPSSAKSATLCLINAQRAANALAPLTAQPVLEAAATGYAQAMVEQRFFAHVSPSGETLDERLAAYTTGAGGFTIGENLAWGQGVLGTPAATVNAWMRSQGHRDNILSAGFQEIGIGIASGSPAGGLLDGGATYVTEFGTRGAARGASPAHASSASVDVTALRAAKAPAKPKPLSAKAKRRISKECHAVARRKKASAKTRRARYDRCVRTRTAAARKAAR